MKILLCSPCGIAYVVEEGRYFVVIRLVVYTPVASDVSWCMGSKREDTTDYKGNSNLLFSKNWKRK